MLDDKQENEEQDNTEQGEIVDPHTDREPDRDK